MNNLVEIVNLTKKYGANVAVNKSDRKSPQGEDHWPVGTQRQR